MKISEAMRRGAKMGPQVFEVYGDGDGGTCALGAVLLGGGIAISENLYSCMLHNDFKELMVKVFPKLVETHSCPVPTCRGVNPIYGRPYLSNTIIHLNEEHKWTRERIAGWIEAHVEVPTYSMLDIQHYMGEPVIEEVVCVR